VCLLECSFTMNRCVNGIASGLLLSGSLQREEFYSRSQTLRCLAAIVEQRDQKTRTGIGWTIIPAQPHELRFVRTGTRGAASSCKAGSVCPRRSQASGAFFDYVMGLGRSFGTGTINKQTAQPRQFGTHLKSQHQQEEGTNAEADLHYRSVRSRRRRDLRLVTEHARLFARHYCSLPPSTLSLSEAKAATTLMISPGEMMIHKGRPLPIEQWDAW
jgi:hypothetical protein